MSHLILSLGLFLIGNVHAMDCKLAKSTEEKLICKTPELFELDRSLNDEYQTYKKKLSVSIDDEAKLSILKDNQKYWAKETLQKNDRKADVSSLRAKYQDRIEKLKIANGKFGIETRQIGKEWAEKRVNGKILFKYPVVSHKKINELIEAKANELANESVGCSLVPFENMSIFENYEFQIEFAKADLFVMRILDQSEGCLCGCAHPALNRFDFYAYDLQSGNDVTQAWKAPFKIKSEFAKKFWTTVIQHNKSKKEFVSLDTECRDSYKVEELSEYAQIILKKDHFEVEPDFPHALQNCIIDLEVPLQTVKPWIQMDPEFIKLVPRLVSGQRITSELSERM